MLYDSQVKTELRYTSNCYISFFWALRDPKVGSVMKNDFEPPEGKVLKDILSHEKRSLKKKKLSYST